MKNFLLRNKIILSIAVCTIVSLLILLIPGFEKHREILYRSMWNNAMEDIKLAGDQSESVPEGGNLFINETQDECTEFHNYIIFSTCVIGGQTVSRGFLGNIYLAPKEVINEGVNNTVKDVFIEKIQGDTTDEAAVEEEITTRRIRANE